MEFGFVDLDNNGSELPKQERSYPFKDELNPVSKMGKNAHDLSFFSDSKQQMLSFSTATNNEHNVVNILGDKDKKVLSPISAPSSFGSGNMNGGMHGIMAGIRGSFTPAQWIELEHQAMIYKYLTANVPVPSNLLIPIRKAIQSASFPGFSIGSYPSHSSYGWGSFHFGFSRNTDPELGRCRRTDGKKWRCSKDAVPDLKYCEKHVNRGRHRSRKLVESHSGKAASATATTNLVPPMPASMSSLLASDGGVSSGTVIAQHQILGLQPNGPNNASIDPIAKRLNDWQDHSVMPSAINMGSNNPQYSIAKQHLSFEESPVSNFGIVSNDSLLNPSQKSSYLEGKSYDSLLELNSQQKQDQYPLRHIMDNWPKDQSKHSFVPWSKGLKSACPQISMSISKSTDFSSSSNQEKAGPCELDPAQMGLGVGTIVPEIGTKQNAWTPIARGNSTGGPLGEALLNNASRIMDNGERWDGNQLGTSPTGVLQTTTFVSLSNSSSCESPRDKKKKMLEVCLA